ncbi:hypothetical protein FHG87_021218 [Trinorchestia longiramus]|nr:hypothetical protein FHG87_021218 [Trinorchestia longiramus]
MASEDKDVDMQVSEEVSKTECSISSKAAGASSCGSSSPATNAEIEDCASQETQLSKNSLTTDRLESSSSPASSDGCSRLEPSTEMDTSEAKEQTDTTDSPSQAAVEPLPPHPIAGMLNKQGCKVRLTFKLELDQVWLGTKQRTKKVFMTSIRSVVSEPIVGREEYHIMVGDVCEPIVGREEYHIMVGDVCEPIVGREEYHIMCSLGC